MQEQSCKCFSVVMNGTSHLTFLVSLTLEEVDSIEI